MVQSLPSILRVVWFCRGRFAAGSKSSPRRAKCGSFGRTGSESRFPSRRAMCCAVTRSGRRRLCPRASMIAADSSCGYRRAAELARASPARAPCVGEGDRRATSSRPPAGSRGEPLLRPEIAHQLLHDSFAGFRVVDSLVETHGHFSESAWPRARRAAASTTP